MRLGNMYLICKKYLDVIRGIKLIEQTSGSGQFAVKYWEIEDWEQAVTQLRQLLPIDALKDLVQGILNFGERRAITGRLRLDADNRKKFTDFVHVLLTKMETIISLCESLGYEDLPDDVSGIDVKFPDDADMDVHAECISELQFVIKHFPYLHKPDGAIKFRSLDVGSEWWTFFVVSGAVASVLHIMQQFVALWEGAIVLRSHRLTLEQQKKALERGNAKDSFMNNLMSTYEELMRIEKERVMRTVVEASDVALTAEERTALEKCMDGATNLLMKGVEIYAAIDGNRDVTPVFPPVEMQRLPVTDLKLLGNSKDSPD